MGGMKSANSTFMNGGFGRKTANNTQADESDEE